MQALPGPMFNFSAFLGGVARGPMGALVAWASLFDPGLLLIIAALPYWAEVQGSARAKAVLRGVNAVACGLVVAAAFLLAQHDAATLPQQAIAVVCFSATQLVGVHPALVVVLGAIGPPLCAAVDCSAWGGAAGVWGRWGLVWAREWQWLELGQRTGARFVGHSCRIFITSNHLSPRYRTLSLHRVTLTGPSR